MLRASPRLPVKLSTSLEVAKPLDDRILIPPFHFYCWVIFFHRFFFFFKKDVSCVLGFFGKNYKKIDKKPSYGAEEEHLLNWNWKWQINSKVKLYQANIFSNPQTAAPDTQNSIPYSSSYMPGQKSIATLSPPPPGWVSHGCSGTGRCLHWWTRPPAPSTCRWRPAACRSASASASQWSPLRIGPPSSGTPHPIGPSRHFSDGKMVGQMESTLYLSFFFPFDFSIGGWKVKLCFPFRKCEENICVHRTILRILFILCVRI